MKNAKCFNEPSPNRNKAPYCVCLIIKMNINFINVTVYAKVDSHNIIISFSPLDMYILYHLYGHNKSQTFNGNVLYIDMTQS